MTLTLEEVIKHCEEVAEKQRSKAHVYEDMMVFNQTIKHNSEAEYYEALMNECIEYAEEYRQFAEWLKELKSYKDKDMRLIYAYPLDEAIRCAMCTNPIKSDRGCDGGCKVDEQMYKNVMEAINGLIVEVNADGDSD